MKLTKKQREDLHPAVEHQAHRRERPLVPRLHGGVNVSWDKNENFALPETIIYEVLEKYAFFKNAHLVVEPDSGEISIRTGLEFHRNNDGNIYVVPFRKGVRRWPASG